MIRDYGLSCERNVKGSNSAPCYFNTRCNTVQKEKTPHIGGVSGALDHLRKRIATLGIKGLVVVLLVEGNRAWPGLVGVSPNPET